MKPVWLATLLLAAGSHAQEPGPVSPRKIESYPARAQIGASWLGADFLVRSFGSGGQMYLAGDYLVVEVAFCPAKDETPLVAISHFTLRVNGKKPELLAQPPQFVAASLRHPDLQQRPKLVATAGVGDTGVIVGRRAPTERFPGDPRTTRDRLPPPPRVPAGEDRSGLDRPEPAKPEDVAVAQALPEGAAKGPVAGYLYFPWRGKAKAIKKVELLYQSPSGAAALSLR